MTQKFGVSMPDDVAERIEEPLEWGESRSSRILELIRVGLLVESKLAEYHVHAPATQEKLAVVRDAMDYYAEEEGYVEE